MVDNVSRGTQPTDEPGTAPARSLGDPSVVDDTASSVTDPNPLQSSGNGAVPQPPEAARRLFGERLAQARRYVDMLAGPGVVRGLLGPREVPRLWDRHILNCAVVAELVPHGSIVVDVGSGAGLPGIVLAILRPDLRITLLEPLLRRTTFLQECVDELDLRNVRVLRGRAEEFAGHLAADVVTARAVAPLNRLAGWCLPLVREGGEMLAVKGSSAQEELQAAERELTRLGAVDWSVAHVGSEFVDPPTTVVRVRAGRGVQERRRKRRKR